jgi:outer membrane protein OmpA-like peptidoglycan-associated protein
MKIRYLLLLTFITTALIGGTYPRAEASGNSGVVMTESGAFLGSNPAGIAFERNHIFYLSLFRPYWGIGDPMWRGAAGYAHHFRAFDAGIDLQYFQSEMVFRGDFGLTFTKRFGKFAVGVRPTFVFDNYRTDNFHYIDGDNPNDPLFNEATGGFGISGDFGVYYYLSEKIAIAGMAENLLDPNMALSATAESKRGSCFSFGAAYHLGHYGTAFAQGGYATETAQGNELNFGAGFESNALHPNLDLRIGFSQSDASLGFGFRLPTDLPIRLDYSFSYPLSDLRKAATSHRLAMVGEIIPIIKFPDLTVTATIDDEVFPTGDSAQISAFITSKRLRTSDVTVVLILDGDKEIARTVIGKIEADEGYEWTPKVLFDSGREWDFSIQVDPANKIDESDKSNNRASVRARSYDGPDVKLLASPEVLKVQSVDYVYQDESIVPAVFFEIGKADIDPRFSPLIDLLAERLLENPDAKFYIDGHFDPETEPGQSDLAGTRAQNLITELVSRAPQLQERIAVGNKTAESKRVDRISQYDRYQSSIDAENRRAEITVEFPEFRREIDLNIFSDTEAKEIASKVQELLRRNPHVVGVIRSSEIERDLAEALKDAFTAKDKLKSAIPDYLHTQILAGASKLVDSGKTEFLLSGEGILYRPKEIHSALNFEPRVFADCRIEMRVEAPLGITDWRVYLAEKTGKSLFDIKTGEGNPPNYINWDWRDPDGGLLPFGQKFDICVDVGDRFGRRATSCAEGVGTEVIRLEQRTDRLLLVQFVFDGPAAQSNYLQDRLEEVARHIIEHGSKPGVKLDAELQGHTDEIGGERRNYELSEERAKAVEKRLRAYMRSILSLPSESALDSWMAENEITLKSVGYGDKMPYTLDLWVGGELREVEVGDNSRPEGRNINRRVLIVIHETNPKGGGNE